MTKVHSYNLGLRQRIKGLSVGEGEITLKPEMPYSIVNLVADYGHKYAQENNLRKITMI